MAVPDFRHARPQSVCAIRQLCCRKVEVKHPIADGRSSLTAVGRPAMTTQRHGGSRATISTIMSSHSILIESQQILASSFAVVLF